MTKSLYKYRETIQYLIESTPAGMFMAVLAGPATLMRMGRIFFAPATEWTSMTLDIYEEIK